jgi:hypothetical protein
MNGWDFGIMWMAGRALLEGRDPYSISEFYYPLPYAYFMALLALIPQQIAFGLWVIICFALLVYFLRKPFWHWLFYVPLLHLFSAGQNEIIWWGLERMMQRGWRGAIWGAFITLKPQTALVLLPYHLMDWLRHDRRTFVRWLGCAAVLWGMPLLWAPNWLGDWLRARAQTDFMLSASNAPSIFSLLKNFPTLLPLLIFVAIGLLLWGIWQNREVSRAALMLASPVGLYYTTFALMGTAPARLLVPLSILAAILTIVLRSFAAFALLPLAVLIYHQRRQPVKSALPPTEDV